MTLPTLLDPSPMRRPGRRPPATWRREQGLPEQAPAQRIRPLTPRGLLSPDEVAELLGVSAKTVRRIAASGELGARVHVGPRGLLRLHRAEVEAYVARQTEGN